MLYFLAGTDKGDNEVDSKASKTSTNICDTQQSGVTNGDNISTDAMPVDSVVRASESQAIAGSSTKQAKLEEGMKTCNSESTVFRPRSPDNSPDTAEDATFKVIFSKSKYDITFPLDDTVAQLKDHLEVITGELM